MQATTDHFRRRCRATRRCRRAATAASHRPLHAATLCSLALETLYSKADDLRFCQLLGTYAQHLSITVPMALLRCWTDCAGGWALQRRWAAATDDIESTFRNLGVPADHVWEAVASCFDNEWRVIWPAQAVLPLAHVASRLEGITLGQAASRLLAPTGRTLLFCLVEKVSAVAQYV